MCVLFTLQEEQPTFSYEVIIVNDGSKDKTTKVCAVPLPAMNALSSSIVDYRSPC